MFLVAMLAGVVLLPGPAGAAAAERRPGAVVVIGTAGLTWSDIDKNRTPNLWLMLRDGSTAALSVRSVYSTTCSLDGWLGLSSGSRAAAPRPGAAPDIDDRPCPPAPQVQDGTVAGWSTYLRAATAESFSARLGLIGDLAARQDICIRALGSQAAIGAATSRGRVARWSPLQQASLIGDLNTCPVTFVDVGVVRDPDDLPRGEAAPSAPRADQVKRLDGRIGQVLSAGPNGADYLVASLGDAGSTERLRLVAARGPHFGPGTLYSGSTRQQGLVQSPDLTATVLDLAGIEIPSTLGGSVLTSSTAADNSERRAQGRLQLLRDFDEASHDVHRLVPPFFAALAVGQLVVYLLVLLVWKGRIGTETTRVTVLTRVRILATAAASVPVSTFLANLVPWWRFPIEMISVVAVVAGFAAVITITALRGPWRHWALGPMAFVAGVTVAVLAADIVSGSRLQLSSLMGLQPTDAGRFYGMGNSTFALFATATLLLATAVSSMLVLAGRQRAGGIAAGAIGGAAVVIDGAPWWGADGGGPPGLIIGVAILVMSVLGIRLTWTRALTIIAAVVVLFFAVAGFDWLRDPGDRSHLGRFLQAIIDGTADDIIARKAEGNLAVLFGNVPLTLMVPAALVFVFAVLARPTSWGSRALRRSFEQAPTLRVGLVAVMVAMTIGFLVNDSGVAIPAVGATVAVPLVVSVAVSHLRDEARARARASRRSESRGGARAAESTPEVVPAVTESASATAAGRTPMSRTEARSAARAGRRGR
jgi:hypothetical protein